MEVVETIKYDFGAQRKSGIQRNITFIKTSPEGKKLFSPIWVDLVVDERGNKYQWGQKKVGNDLQVKINDPKKDVSGLKTYIISYEVRGAFTYFSDHDELRWDVTGDKWGVKIDKASATVMLPNVIDDRDIQMVCNDCQTYHSGMESSFSTKAALKPSQSLSFVLGFPKGVVAEVAPYTYIGFWDRWYGKVFKIMIIMIAVIVAFVLLLSLAQKYPLTKNKNKGF